MCFNSVWDIQLLDIVVILSVTDWLLDKVGFILVLGVISEGSILATVLKGT